MTAHGAIINDGIDIKPLLEFKDRVREDPSKADRNPTVVAEWTGGDQSRINLAGIETYLGGDGYLNSMQMLLACLAACEVDLVAMHASFLGVKIESLSVVASGHFNVRSYLGFEDAPGSGYDKIAYTVRIHAPRATQKDIDYLIEKCELASPVGDSLSRAIPVELNFVANQ
jgi:uncharacterized OsmC-like protein